MFIIHQNFEERSIYDYYRKSRVIEGGTAMNKQELIDKYTAEISRLRPYCPNRHLISDQLKYGLYKEILEDLKQLDEPQKPAVPKFVAEWIEYAKRKAIV